MAFFGSWDGARLEKLGALLAREITLRPDGFGSLPEDTAFWSCTAAQCNEENGNQTVPLTRVRSNELCACATIELDCLDITRVYDGGDRALYLTDVPSGMSRLAHAVLGTSQLIIIGGYKVLGACSTWDRKPRLADTTCWIDTEQPLAAQLVDAARFANRAPTMVASPDGRGTGALICAAIIAAREGFSSSVALREVEKRRAPPLRIEVDDREELDKFCQNLLFAEFCLRLGEPSTTKDDSTMRKVEYTRPEDLVPVRLTLAGSPLNAASTTPEMQAARPLALSPLKRSSSASESPSRCAGRKARKVVPSELDGWKLG